MPGAKITLPPLTYAGEGALENLLPEVEKFRPSNILVITDPILLDIGLVEAVIGPLKAAGYKLDVYTDIEPEPPLACGEKLVDYTRAGGFDLILGVGGGSALDLAKLTAVLAAHEGPVKDYLNLTATRQVEHKGYPKILLPTTSGTGSEVTNIAVLSLESTKDVVTHDNLLADVAIVEPKLTLSMPPRVTAATGIDALTHAVEAYVSIHANPTTDALALQAIRLISGSLRRAYRNGRDKEARSQMSYASYMAGLAFFNAGVAGVHALAYPLGGQFHIAHGESNAVLLPYVMEYIRTSCRKRMADVLEALGISTAYMSEEEASLRCVEELQRIVADVGIPATLQEFSIPESALPLLVEDGVKQKRLLARSPMPLEKKDIAAIYRAAFTGEVVEPL